MAIERIESSDTAIGSVVSPGDFRRACGRFATGICIAATRDRGIDYAMTVSAFTSVSLDPLLVLVCVEKITRFHEAVLSSGAWTVSVLPDDADDVSRWFAEKGRPTAGQFADYRHHPGEVTGMPVLDIAISVLECRTRAVYDGGDHDILLADVVGAWTDPRPRRPLLYVEGHYRNVAD
ncbi:MAG TPA: flavin reductase family protein [Acidimicrobiales bacterium]|nr:flavin reductase family protein [Acidimicrobiales bacterium]